MSIITSCEKFSIWGIRILQICFCALILGPLHWFLSSAFKPANVYPGYQLYFPLGVSWAAIVVAAGSFVLVCCVQKVGMAVYAGLDAMVCALYVVSAAMYRHNFHILPHRNALRNDVVALRRVLGKGTDRIRVGALVRLDAAAIIIQIFLFFTTAVLSYRASKRYQRKALGAV